MTKFTRDSFNKEAQKFIGDATFNALLEQQCSSIKQFFILKKLASLTPTLVTIAPEIHKPRVHLIDEPDFNDNRHKILYETGVRLWKEQIPIAAVFLISEAWIKENSDLSIRKPVRDYDDKKEAIICTGLTIDGRNNTAIMNVHRTISGTMRLKPISFLKHYTSVSSPESLIDVTCPLLNQFYAGYLEAVSSKKK